MNVLTFEKTEEVVERRWEVPFNNYDDILHSMLTFFEISTLSMWPDNMYNAIDSVELDHVPIMEYNVGVSLIYILFIFLVRHQLIR